MAALSLLQASLCLVAPVAPVGSVERVAVALERLEAVHDGVSPPHSVVDACLDVCRSLPLGAVPDDARSLQEAAAFFDWANGDVLGQHLFDVLLWDDALEALARGLTEADGGRVAEGAAAVAASARFMLLSEAAQRDALDALDAAVDGDAFLAARRATLAAARGRRAAPQSAADAFATARLRRKKHDFVAVPPTPDEDERIIRALYASTVEQLGHTVLWPLRFPPTKLGLRSLVGAARASGSQRASAILGRVWHAADQPGPIIFAHHATAAGMPAAGMPAAGVPVGVAPAARTGARTLVLVFSSLGWHGVVRAEWGATLRFAGDDALDVAHCLDTSQSWFQTHPHTGEYDDGAWWDAELSRIAAPYERVCILGESMGATAALRYARHATCTGRVVALVPQIDVRDFGYAGRADFGDARKTALREAISAACEQAAATVVLHVGMDPPDVHQLTYLPPESERMRVMRHDVPGHALGAGLKAQGLLRRTVLRDLLGHTFRLPAAREG